jgi:hypothetical protein
MTDYRESEASRIATAGMPTAKHGTWSTKQARAWAQSSPPQPPKLPPVGMAGRLGRVISWVANAAAAIVLVATIATWNAVREANMPGVSWHGRFYVVDALPWGAPPPPGFERPEINIAHGALLLLALSIWGTGRAIRYVLAGE